MRGFGRKTWTVLGVAGLAILGINTDESWGLGFGDGLTVLSSLAFAFFIISLDRLGRTVNSSHLTLVLIAVTGYGQHEDRARTHAAGFDHHLVKPVDIEQLYAILARVASPPDRGTGLHSTGL